MALTRDFKQTVVERVQRDPAFARAMLDEAATLFLSGDPRTARLILRDPVNATYRLRRTGDRDGDARQEPSSHALAKGQPQHGQSRRHLRCHTQGASCRDLGSHR